eukprot:2354562-Rhodomonas_salina.2
MTRGTFGNLDAVKARWTNLRLECDWAIQTEFDDDDDDDKDDDDDLRQKEQPERCQSSRRGPS